MKRDKPSHSTGVAVPIVPICSEACDLAERRAGVVRAQGRY
jgi:hypothetical protein